MTVLAIDPGVDFTGVACKKDGYAFVKTLSGEGFGVGRLVSMVEEIMAVITFEKPEVIVVEDYGFGGKFFNVEVAELVGSLKYCIRMTGLKCTVTALAPNTVKRVVTGNGRAKKPEVMKAVAAIVPGVRVKTDHEADALALLIVMGKCLNEELSAADLRMIRGRTYQNVPDNRK